MVPSKRSLLLHLGAALLADSYQLHREGISSIAVLMGNILLARSTHGDDGNEAAMQIHVGDASETCVCVCV